MSRSKIIALVLPAVLLSGCGMSGRGLESVHQPVVSRADYAFDAATTGYGLAPGEADRIAGWMRTINVGYGDTVSLDDPAGAPGPRADIAAIAAHYGLLLAATAPVTAGQIAPGTVRVIVTRAVARVPGCPDFRFEDGSPNFTGRTSSNYGCGLNSTLAAMVASPADLVRGQPGAPTVDPAASTKAIDAFRKAEPSGGGGQAVKAESTGSN